MADEGRRDGAEVHSPGGTSGPGETSRADETRDPDETRGPDETVRWLELEDARDMLLLAAAVLERWERRLKRVADHLPEPRFEDETDEPANLSAAWQALLITLLDDELRPAIAALRRAATWQDDPVGGFPSG